MYTYCSAVFYFIFLLASTSAGKTAKNLKWNLAFFEFMQEI